MLSKQGRLGFVVNENVDLFVHRLEREVDPKSRSTLRELLIREEDRFAERSERLELLNNQIRRADERIRQQRDLIERLECSGDDTRLARQTLANLVDVHQLFLAHRQELASSGDNGRI